MDIENKIISLKENIKQHQNQIKKLETFKNTNKNISINNIDTLCDDTNNNKSIKTLNDFC